MGRLTLRIFGGFEVEALGRPLAVPTRKAQALLAYLALTPGQTHLREKLAALLWPDMSLGPARQALRQTLFLLRRALGSGELARIVLTGDAVTLPTEAVQTDVSAFERAVAEGTPSALEQAVVLYRGDLLAGLGVTAPPFEDWLMSERERLRELAIEAVARLLAHQRAAGATAAAAQSALRLLALDPLQEAVHRTLMRLHVQLGRRDAALRQYQECVDVLRRELTVEPEAETQELYREILRQRPVRAATRTRVAAGLPETPLVGRDGEVSRLRELLAEAWTGQGRLVAVVGEAGIGKSRLLAHLAADAGRRGGSILLGRAYESEQILAFNPWVGALRDAGVIADPGTLEDLGSAWVAELARLFPELAEAGRPAPAGPADPLRLFEALAQLLRRLALARPVLVLLEDCHWADDMTLRFLAFFGRRIHAAPILVAVSARDEELADSPLLTRTLDDLAAEGRLTRVPLGRLARDDTLALVRLLGRADSWPAVVAQRGDQVWAASGGNPFIVVETMRAIDEGAEVESSAALPVPARVRDMIARRLDNLGPLGRQLAAVAAVIGREFDFALLQEASGLEPAGAAEGLEELVRRRVVHGVGERFDFTHDRIREVAYGRLLLPRRRALHGAVAAAIEARHAGNLEPHDAALAFHFREGEVWPKAVRYLQRASGQAMAHGAYREAAAALEGALAAVEHLTGPEAAPSALELRLHLRNALLPLGDQARMLANLREAEALAESLGDQRRLGWILSYSALEVWRLGDAERAIGLAERVLAIAAALDDAGLRIIAGIRLGQAFHGLGRYAEAIDALRATIAELHGDRQREHYGLSAPPSVIAPTWLAWCLAERGELGEGRRHAADALAIAEAMNQPYPLVAACFGLGLLHLRRGDHDGAILLLERGMALARVREIPVFFAWTASSLALAYLLAGQPERGQPLLEPPTEPDIMAKAAQQAFPLLWLGEAHLLAGRLDAAAERARQALDLARARHERGHEAYARRLLAEIANRREPPDAVEAERLYRDAVATAEALGMRPLAAHCRAGLGRLYHRTGRAEAGAAEAAAATAAYRSMQMNF